LSSRHMTTSAFQKRVHLWLMKAGRHLQVPEMCSDVVGIAAQLQGDDFWRHCIDPTRLNGNMCMFVLSVFRTLVLSELGLCMSYVPTSRMWLALCLKTCVQPLQLIKSYACFQALYNVDD
jgi:hypothetical protein